MSTKKGARTSCCHVCKTSMNQYRREYIECTKPGCNKIVCRLCFASRLKDKSWEEAKTEGNFQCPQCTGTCPCERCLKLKIKDMTPKTTPVKTNGLHKVNSPPRDFKTEPIEEKPTLDTLLHQTTSSPEKSKKVQTPIINNVKRKKITKTRSEELADGSSSDEDYGTGYDSDGPARKRDRKVPCQPINSQDTINILLERLQEMEQAHHILQGTVVRLVQDVSELKKENSTMEKKMNMMTQELQTLRQNNNVSKELGQYYCGMPMLSMDIISKTYHEFESVSMSSPKINTFSFIDE